MECCRGSQFDAKWPPVGQCPLAHALTRGTRGRGTASVNRSLIGSEVAGDHSGVVTDLSRRTLSNDRPGFETIHTIADAQNKRRVVLNQEYRCTKLALNATMSGPNASVSRCAKAAVGSSRHSTGALRARRPASSTIRRVPVDSVMVSPVSQTE